MAPAPTGTAAAAPMGAVASTCSQEGGRAAPRLLGAINDPTKWVVSGSVFAVLLLRRDARVCWCIVGAILAAFNCKVLKGMLNMARPAGARKADPGMPSSHAQSLAYLSGYAALELVSLGGAAAVTGAGAVCAGGLFLSWLRIRLGYHTFEQVAVGHMLGLACACGWHRLGDAGVLEALAPEVLYGVTAISITGFAVAMVSSWLRERKTS
eukprot:TRINITY_DN41151_c0_g1_i1.p2 TRINITY_DN41151_c0_g1~~TRINITY_DN41151_c0_g1_i1.p2  ORF type:complete len:217 (-),score=50.86 TRINITY_DN41151_c0_g1_i1:106-735(-)